MKNFVFYILISIVFSSCYIPKYVHSGNVTSTLDFNEGKWLLNNITAPINAKEDLTKVAVNSFKKLLKDRFLDINQSENLLFPANIEILNKESLKDIKNGTNYDYFIDIRADILSNEFGDVLVFGSNSDMHNIVNVEVKIYDLNLLEEFYTHSVTANLFINENNKNFVFARGTNKMLRESLERIIKKMKKNQLTK